MSGPHLEPTLRVRINQIDYTLEPPGPLDNSTLPRVPIIRIYGASSTGQKACLHVHQVYPYVFVEYNGKMNPDSVNRYISRLSHSLNHAVAISMKRNPHSPKSRFIRAVILVKGIHFYGFHSSYRPFLKIFIADPAFVNRATTILQSGTVMQTRFRVFESHLSFILQFLCDFGLYGCGWIELGDVWKRGNDDESTGDEPACQPDGTPFSQSPHFRQSRMRLEVDTAAHQILNRHLLTARNIHHKLEIPAPPLPSEPLVLSVRELWEDERRRRVENGLTPSPEIPLDPSENSRGKGGGWVAEARWWEEIRHRIEKERPDVPEAHPNGVGASWEKWVMTTFESIEALWEDRYKTWQPGGTRTTAASVGREIHNPFGTAGGSEPKGHRLVDEGDAAADVDESMLSSQAISQLVEREEAEWHKYAGNNDAVNADGKDNDEDAFAEDPLEPEDGPPPDMQNVEDLENVELNRTAAVNTQPATNDDPFTSTPQSSHKPNTFQEAFLKLSRSHTQRGTSNDPATPTKLCRNRTQAASGSPTSTGPDSTPLIPTLPASHINHEGDQLTEDVSPSPSPSPSTRRLPPLSFGNELSIGSPLPSQAIDDPHPWAPPSQRFPPSPPCQTHHPSHSFPKTQVITSTPTHNLSTNGYAYGFVPPSSSELMATIQDYGLPSKIYCAPHYSNGTDAPEKPREYAGMLYHLRGGDGLDVLENWNGEVGALPRPPKLDPYNVWGWEYASSPPSVREVKSWLKSDVGMPPTVYQRKARSQIEGPTQANIYGLKHTPGTLADPAVRERQTMTVFSCEVFAASRGSLVPDPGVDEAVAIFYAFQEAHNMDVGQGFSCQSGIIAVENPLNFHPNRLRHSDIEFVDSELDLLNRLVDIVLEVDPDIVSGWEVQAASWGYLNARGTHYGFDIGELISRAPTTRKNDGVDQWGSRQTSTFKVVGRHVLNVWRIMRAEQSLSMYTFENVVFHLMQKRVPRYSHSTLTAWFRSTVPAHTARLVLYFSTRTAMVLQILDKAEVVTKTAEFARVFGVDFFSVISRGSQFKVESFMFRIAKPESFVLISPSKQDVGKQNAAECMPLIMEPLSAFYNSPLVVLDFQSLYPSIMIAYNYCYSTCLGRVTEFQGQNKFGVVDLDVPPGLLENLQDHIHVAPNGMMYVKAEVRRGLLGRMLTELLDTRIMVKQAMKGVKDDKALTRILNARQLSLKFICNVTYGYTSASYSGRMPAVEIADSIVQSGRETLEKAIRVIDSNPKWGAKVVYGDTDSLFIYLKGKTKAQAFRIGHDMANTITAQNPAPIKLKFEKVYLPCVLMAKKRYVGFKYENPDDKEPGFDAKGIETVRRDGIPAQQKMTETCLKIFFRTQDLSKVKEYCTRTWLQMLQNKASVQDFIFAKEVRMGTYSDKVPPPPGVTVAARRLLEDENDEPQYGERVPYVILRGDPNSRLVDRAISPHQFLEKRQHRLDYGYYISRVLIPPLERIFNLVGADIRSWYDDMPKSMKVDVPQSNALSSPSRAMATIARQFQIDEHFHSTNCLVCGASTPSGLCDNCRLSPQTTVTALLRRIDDSEKSLVDVQRICASCAGTDLAAPIECDSIDCSWFFERRKAEDRVNLEVFSAIQDLIVDIEGDSEPL